MVFQYKPVDAAHRNLVREWLVKPHAAEWFYGQGLANTFKHLDEFLQGSSYGQYWLGFEGEKPFAFLITSVVQKPDKWSISPGKTITLDLLIGEEEHLGKGFGVRLIEEFLASEFPDVDEVLIDPEATNARAIHVYKKAGFSPVGEFIPSHSPHLHLMMRKILKKTPIPVK